MDSVATANPRVYLENVQPYGSTLNSAYSVTVRICYSSKVIRLIILRKERTLPKPATEWDNASCKDGEDCD